MYIVGPEISQRFSCKCNLRRLKDEDEEDVERKHQKYQGQRYLAIDFYKFAQESHLRGSGVIATDKSADDLRDQAFYRQNSSLELSG